MFAIFRMIRRYDLCHQSFHPVCLLVCRLIQLSEFLFKCCVIHLDRFADMDQFVWCLLHAFFCHQEFFEKFFARTQAGVLDFDVYIRCESGQVDILYYCPEHGWEVLQGEKISDNQVAAYFHAGSSVMALIYREKGATVGTSQVSPQTGARSTWPIAVSAIFFVSFGIFALYKSKKA